MPSFYFNSNSVGVLGQVSIVSHSLQTYFSFTGSDLNLDCGLCDHVITRFASVKQTPYDIQYNIP